MQYDYLVVGSGLFGAVFANLARSKGKRCLVVEKRSHIGGNVHTYEQDGIQVHKYGAHIFHTSDSEVWNFVNKFARFNNFINSPLANYQGKLFNLPFNMNTFHQIWGVKTPAEAMQKIEEQRQQAGINAPRNLEEQAISLVGEDIYKILIKGYTEKQWGRSCRELPASIIKRLPVRFRFDNNYFNDRYQGIPEEGYTSLIQKLLDGIEVRLNCDFLKCQSELVKTAKKVIFTGPIDEYFNYELGALSYRSVRFETETLPINNYQGVAVVNYTERSVPYTRIIEHKHFAFGEQDHTVISREYPSEWSIGEEPYYPVNDQRNMMLFEKYQELAKGLSNVYFGGRLGQYRYYDMDKVVREAFSLFQKIDNEQSPIS